MTIDIQTLIEQRGHLKEPLELYAKWLRFHREAVELLPKERASLSPEESRAYPRKSAGPIFQLFVSIFDLPGAELEPLAGALADGALDFMRLPQGELPDLGPSSSDTFVATLLYLLSRPYFLSLRESFPVDGKPWEQGRCPVCSAQAALSTVAEGPKRFLHCSFCGASGPYRFIGCPNCGTGDAAQLNTILSDDEPGFRVITCDACRTYLKVAENSILAEMSIDLADMASLPLDLVAQEKGYSRMAPNPIGLKKMT